MEVRVMSDHLNLLWFAPYQVPHDSLFVFDAIEVRCPFISMKNEEHCWRVDHVIEYVADV